MGWMMKVRNGGRLGVWGRWCTATALALMLAACQTPQPKGLTPHQQQVLRAQGFGKIPRIFQTLISPTAGPGPTAQPAPTASSSPTSAPSASLSQIASPSSSPGATAG